MVNVTEIGEMGAYVTLLEYDDIEVSGTVVDAGVATTERSRIPSNYLFSPPHCTGYDLAIGAV
jgi:hypothetical protein